VSDPAPLRRHLPRRTADTVQGHVAKPGPTRQAFDYFDAPQTP
jgi:hypothetical protein